MKKFPVSLFLLALSFFLGGCDDGVALPTATSVEILPTHRVLKDVRKIEELRQFIAGLSGGWHRSPVTQRAPQLTVEVRSGDLISAHIYIGEDWVSVSLAGDTGGFFSKNPPERVLSAQERAQLMKLFSP